MKNIGQAGRYFQYDVRTFSRYQIFKNKSIFAQHFPDYGHSIGSIQNIMVVFLVVNNG